MSGVHPARPHEPGSLPLWQGSSCCRTQGTILPEQAPPGEIAGPAGSGTRHTVSAVTIDPGWPVALSCLLLLALTLAMYVLGGLPAPSATSVAAARAVLQLGLAALVIASVIRSLALSILLLCVMFTVAVGTTVRRIGAPRAWPWAGVAMLAGLAPVVTIILLTRTIPPSGIALIPVVGILAGNTMNGHTLVGRRAFAALREEHHQYEAALSLGMPREHAIHEVIHRRLPEALVPGLDQVRTVGVVTLPGAFVGVLLGGGTPAQAAAAQILVLLGIMAAQTTTAVVAERLIGAARLLPEDLRVSLIR